MIRRLLFNLKQRFEFRKLRPNMDQVELARYKFLNEYYVVEANSYIEWITTAKMLSALLDMRMESYLKDGKHIWRPYRYIEASRFFGRVKCTSTPSRQNHILSFEQFSELYLISGKEVKLHNYEHLL